jgi:hypothetical protein
MDLPSAVLSFTFPMTSGFGVILSYNRFDIKVDSAAVSTIALILSPFTVMGTDQAFPFDITFGMYNVRT